MSSPEEPIQREPSQSATDASAKPSVRRVRSYWIGGILAVLLIGWGAISLGLPLNVQEEQPSHIATSKTSDAAAKPADRSAHPAGKSSPAVNDPDFRPEQMVGHWLLDGMIRREIWIHPGGTAEMHVTLDYFSALLYGKQLKMELTWSLKNNILTHQIVSGTPEKNVKRLINDFGDSRSYRVVKATARQLVLESPDEDKEIHDWVAVD